MLAAIGESVSERSGLLNLGIEGTMLIGASSGSGSLSDGVFRSGMTAGAGWRPLCSALALAPC